MDGFRAPDPGLPGGAQPISLSSNSTQKPKTSVAILAQATWLTQLGPRRTQAMLQVLILVVLSRVGQGPRVHNDGRFREHLPRPKTVPIAPYSPGRYTAEDSLVIFEHPLLKPAPKPSFVHNPVLPLVDSLTDAQQPAVPLPPPQHLIVSDDDTSVGDTELDSRDDGDDAADADAGGTGLQTGADAADAVDAPLHTGADAVGTPSHTGTNAVIDTHTESLHAGTNAAVNVGDQPTQIETNDVHADTPSHCGAADVETPLNSGAVETTSPLQTGADAAVDTPLLTGAAAVDWARSPFRTGPSAAALEQMARLRAVCDQLAVPGHSKRDIDEQIEDIMFPQKAARKCRRVSCATSAASGSSMPCGLPAYPTQDQYRELVEEVDECEGPGGRPSSSTDVPLEQLLMPQAEDKDAACVEEDISEDEKLLRRLLDEEDQVTEVERITRDHKWTCRLKDRGYLP